MAVLLKNLTARTPHAEDLAALGELMHSCECHENSIAGSTLEELLSEWQRPDFHLANDAWVIVTTGGQMVGFACVWHEAHARISTFICVHPEYRGRGIGTLLLRMAEVRARQHIRLAAPDARVVLRGQVSSTNESAHRLFRGEGYEADRPFLRISFSLPQEGEVEMRAATGRRLTVDVGLDQQERILSASPLWDQDALCSVRQYQTYEKELRPASQGYEDREMGMHELGV